jgi:glycosyltransferase involved in cell wall biosynthesis
MVRRKGLHVGLKVVQRARRSGADVEFDIIGLGPEEESLKRLSTSLGLDGAVRFLGQFPYGTELLRRLATYDLLLFTPTEEDTPRMLYDGYAAGLPLLAANIPFVLHRAKVDGAAVTFPVGDVEAGGEVLSRLCQERARLRDLSNRARLAGLEHSAESWYRRRRDWTVQAVDRSRRRCG